MTHRQVELINAMGLSLGRVSVTESIEALAQELMGRQVHLKHRETSVKSNEALRGTVDEMALGLRLERPDRQRIYLTADSATVAFVCAGAADAPTPRVLLPRKATTSEMGVFSAVVAAGLEELWQGRLRIIQLFQDPVSALREPAMSSGLWVAGTLESEGIWGRWGIMFPPSPLSMAPEDLLPPFLVASRLRNIEATVTVETAPCALTALQLRSLEPDDVLVLYPGSLPGAPFHLKIGRGVFPCRLHGDREPFPPGHPGPSPDQATEERSLPPASGLFYAPRLAICGEFTMNGFTPNEDHENKNAEGHSEPPSDALLQDLQFEAVVQVARVSLPAQDLVAMGPGSVMKLDRPIGGAMDLKVGGKLVARGELVDIEGTLGFRVLERL